MKINYCMARTQATA